VLSVARRAAPDRTEALLRRWPRLAGAPDDARTRFAQRPVRVLARRPFLPVDLPVDVDVVLEQQKRTSERERDLGLARNS